MVFEDPGGTRWRWFRRAFVLACLAGALLIGAGIVTLVTTPKLSKLPVTAPISDAVQVMPLSKTASPVRPVSHSASFLRTAFVVQDDPQSLEDLKRNQDRLDWIFPDWFTVSTADGRLQSRVDPQFRSAVAGSDVKVLPRLANTDSNGVWLGNMLDDLFSEGGRKLIASLVEALEANHAAGVNIDFEEIDPVNRDDFLDWLQDLAKALHARHMLLSVDVPIGQEESFDYEMIGQIADAVIVMGYDEHYSTSAPGPVASQAWFDEAVADMAVRIPPRKLIAALGAYGYDWNLSKKQPAEGLGFQELMDRASRFSARVELDSPGLNSSYSYGDAWGDQHRVWFLDAISAWNQSRSVRQNSYGGVSLWRLGMEEAGFWDAVSAEPQSADLSKLSKVQSSVIVFRGEGEMIDVRRLAHDGKRRISANDSRIDFASYDVLPESCEVERRGHSSTHKVALTFDDGPDPRWTPRVLDVLRSAHVSATFFVVGEQVQKYPQLVQQEFGEGHLVGNHTFFHPDIELLSDRRLTMELTATQRAIEGAVDHQTLLFRAPYDTDSSPRLDSQLRAFHTAGRLGYICAGADIDSDDYKRPGADAICRKVINELHESRANVVVLHDAGGDREQTIQALVELIPQLRQQGYEFVSLADLLGTSPEALMPSVHGAEQAIVAGDEVISLLGKWGWSIMMGLFLLTTSFALLRSALLGTLVYARSRRAPVENADFAPPVLLLIPAYNEEKVIARTIDAALRSDYPAFRVMVVDDGSTDDTANIVAKFARINPQVRLLSKPNGGKFSALNRGFREAWEEYIVTIDADTIILPDTVRRLMGRFVDPAIDAVCGNIEVGNRDGFLTCLQDAEYVTSQNYDRRAFDSSNCIPVVPGACGAWRRGAVLKVGGYTADTLTEDADLTLTMLRDGAKIVYEPTARAITEAPKDTRALLKQRFRWGYGTLQSLWKHRDHFGRGSLGWIALPNLLLFQLIFPALAPLSMLIVLASLLRGAWLLPLIWFSIFVVVDLVGAAVAFRLEGRPLRQLSVVMAQRFYYRPFMYVITLRSLLAAIRGGRHTWNKLERHASVRLEAESQGLPPWRLAPLASHNAA